MCAGSFRKSGKIGVPGRVHRGRGTKGPKSGTSRIIRDGWQPYAGDMDQLSQGTCSEQQETSSGTSTETSITAAAISLFQHLPNRHAQGLSNLQFLTMNVSSLKKIKKRGVRDPPLVMGAWLTV